MKILYIEHKTLFYWDVIIEIFYAETLLDLLMCLLTIIELLQYYDGKP